MKLLSMLLLALKFPADAFAPTIQHATMPGVREVRSNLQFPAAPNSNFPGGLGRRARPLRLGDPGEGEGFFPDTGHLPDRDALFDDEDLVIQESKFSSEGDQPQQQQSNVQLLERRQVLSSALAAWALLNVPAPADAAQLEGANQEDPSQAQKLYGLNAELRDAEDKVRDLKGQFSEKESQERSQLEKQLEIVLSDAARLREKPAASAVLNAPKP